MTIQIYLNSDVADVKLNSSQNSSLLFYLRNPIVPPDGFQMSIKVVNCAIPCSFYLVNSQNNKLVISGTTYTLTSGNYTAYSLSDLIATATSGFVSVAFSTVTSKYTLTSLTNFAINKESTCQKLLGLPTGTDLASSGYSLSSSYPIDLSGDIMLHLAVRNLQMQNMLGGAKTSILKALPVSVSQGGVLFYDDNSGSSGFVIHEDHVGFLHVVLYGEDATTLIDLQNARWSVTLEINFIKKQEYFVAGKSFRELYDKYLQSVQTAPAKLSQN